mmetsp:Transcript_25255/g.37196  ORF Transcript_25255/g.37196 Transcript_25255/m.37196 type:complete len:275 (+) Transcript_25255:413-1237(+)
MSDHSPNGTVFGNVLLDVRRDLLSEHKETLLNALLRGVAFARVPGGAFHCLLHRHKVLVDIKIDERHAQVAGFWVQETMHGFVVHHQANADACPHGDVGEGRLAFFPETVEQELSQCGCVDVGVELVRHGCAARHDQSVHDWADDVGELPLHLGSGGDVAIVGLIPLRLHGPEASNADEVELCLPLFQPSVDDWESLFRLVRGNLEPLDHLARTEVGGHLAQRDLPRGAAALHAGDVDVLCQDARGHRQLRRRCFSHVVSSLACRRTESARRVA